LRCDDPLKNQAKHAVTLNYNDLADAVEKYLLPSGHVCMMLPPEQFMAFLKPASEHNIHPIHLLNVKQSLHSGIFRIVGILAKANSRLYEEEFCIRDGNNGYTREFKALLKDYYLNLQTLSIRR
jgi:tRNA1Val (adenine37-N6)-methyltransferase